MDISQSDLLQPQIRFLIEIMLFFLWKYSLISHGGKNVMQYCSIQIQCDEYENFLSVSTRQLQLQLSGPQLKQQWSLTLAKRKYM